MALFQTTRAFYSLLFRASSRLCLNNLSSFLQVNLQNQHFHAFIPYKWSFYQIQEIDGVCRQDLLRYYKRQQSSNAAIVEGNSYRMQVVLVKGLPLSSNKEFILEHFCDVKVHNGKEGIKLLYQDGLYRGEALIRCESEKDVEKLLMYQNEKSQSRTLQVRRPDWDASFVFTVQQNNSAEITAADSTVIFISRLPYRVQKREIRQFLEGIEVVPDGIILFKKSRNLAKVQLTSLEMVEKACQRDLLTISGRNVRVSRSNLLNLNSPLPVPTVHLEGKSAEYKLKLYLLPPSANSKQILDFLSPLKPVSVKVFTDKMGNCNERALVEFENEEQCLAAEKKIKENLFGNERCRVTVSRFSESLRSFA